MTKFVGPSSAQTRRTKVKTTKDEERRDGVGVLLLYLYAGVFRWMVKRNTMGGRAREHKRKTERKASAE